MQTQEIDSVSKTWAYPDQPHTSANGEPLALITKELATEESNAISLGPGSSGDLHSSSMSSRGTRVDIYLRFQPWPFPITQAAATPGF